MNPSHILISHTSQGQDFAPGLALSLSAASIPGVNDIRFDEEGIIYSRPGYNNTRNLRLRPAANRPLVLTLLPGSFKADGKNKKTEKKTGRVDIRKISFAPANYGAERIQHRRTVT